MSRRTQNPTETDPEHTAPASDAASPLGEDGTPVDQPATISNSVPTTRRDWIQEQGTARQEKLLGVDRIHLLLGSIVTGSLLATIAGVTGAVSLTFLLSFGVALLFLTMVVLAVILLRVTATEDDDEEAYSWAQHQRPRVKRRP